MKKVLIIFICLFANIGVSAEEIEVTFNKCVDGDTAKFMYNNEVITTRFLAIDTPESVHPTIGEEEYGKEASEYTCNKLKNADKIVLEFDDNSNKTDKYNRYLAWVFVDGNLLQKDLIKEGYAEVAYLYGDYKYTEELEVAQEIAKDNKIGIWSLEDTSTPVNKETTKVETVMPTQFNIELNPYVICCSIILIIIICTFSEKGRKKVIKETKRAIKRELKK